MVPQGKQDVTPRERKPAENIEVPVAVAQECADVADALNIPVRAVRDVVAQFAADVLDRKVKGQVARIFSAHVQGILPLPPAAAPSDATKQEGGAG